jgi:hypothetical protein
MSGGAGLGGSSGSGVAANPLCPNTGPIVPGATPLPDGVEIVAAASGVRDLIVADGYVYWTTVSSIQRVPVGGGSVTTLLDRSAQSRATIGWLQVDGATLYFTEVGPDQVAKMPADGSAAPTTIATGNSPWQLIVTGGMVYYYDAGVGELDRVPVAGGTPTPVVLGVSPCKRMAVANGYLYFINPAANGSDVHLLRAAIDGPLPTPVDGGTVPPGAEDVVMTDNYNTYGVVADATSLYWDEDNQVMKAPQAAGAKSVAVAHLPDQSGDFGTTVKTYVGSVVVDGGSLYWNAGLTCGDIFKASSDGSGKTSLVHAVLGSSFLTVDATHVYFWTGQQILRAPR